MSVGVCIGVLCSCGTLGLWVCLMDFLSQYYFYDCGIYKNKTIQVKDTTNCLTFIINIEKCNIYSLDWLVLISSRLVVFYLVLFLLSLLKRVRRKCQIYCISKLLNKQPCGNAKYIAYQNFSTSNPVEGCKGTVIYLISYYVRIWHKVILWWGPCTNWDSCMVDAKILDPVGISLLEHLRHQAINRIQITRGFRIYSNVCMGEGEEWGLCLFLSH